MKTKIWFTVLFLILKANAQETMEHCKVTEHIKSDSASNKHLGYVLLKQNPYNEFVSLFNPNHTYVIESSSSLSVMVRDSSTDHSQKMSDMGNMQFSNKDSKTVLSLECKVDQAQKVLNHLIQDFKSNLKKVNF